MDADELDKKFDEGVEDVLQYFDLDTMIRPGQPSQRVNVDFPTWVVKALDAEAHRMGVTRQSIIKVWLVERLEANAEGRGRRRGAAAAAGGTSDSPDSER